MTQKTNTIAVVDVQSVVATSAKVKALKEEQEKKSQELAQWLQKAQNDVKAETDKAKQEALLQQYNAEFAQKRAILTEQYQKELKIVSSGIEKTIAEEAKKKGYQLVLAKNLTIYGGEDITEDIAKIIE